jgi:hypothetical protein
LPRLKLKRLEARGSLPQARWGHTAAEYNGKIYIFGGRNEFDLNDLYWYDVKKNVWFNKYNQDTHIPKARRRHSAVFVGRSMVLFGGFDGKYFSDMHYMNVRPFDLEYQPQNIHHHYLSLVNNWLFADVVFLAKPKNTRNFVLNELEEKIYAHSALVLYRLSNESCPQFAQDIIEQKKLKEKATVKLPEGITSEAFIRVLEYLYWGVFVNKISFSELKDVIKIWEILELTRAKEYIYNWLKQYQEILSHSENDSSRESSYATLSSDYSLIGTYSSTISFISDDASTNEMTDPSSDSFYRFRNCSELASCPHLQHDRSMKIRTDFELYDGNWTSTDSLLSALEYENQKDIDYDFYKLTKLEVLSPEDIELEDPDLMFTYLIKNNNLTSNFFDVLIWIGEKYYQSNKAILWARSVYFNAMFSSFKESTQQIVKIDVVPQRYFDHIYEFLVTGRTSMKKSCSYLVKLMIYANYLMINDLVAKWVINVRQYLSDYTVFQLYLISKTWNIDCLTEMWLDYLSFKTKGMSDIKNQFFKFWQISSPSVIKEFQKAIERVQNENVVISGAHLASNSNLNPITWNCPLKYKEDLDPILTELMLINEEDLVSGANTSENQNYSSLKTVNQLLTDNTKQIFTDLEDSEIHYESLNFHSSCAYYEHVRNIPRFERNKNSVQNPREFSVQSDYIQMWSKMDEDSDASMEIQESTDEEW